MARAGAYSTAGYAPRPWRCGLRPAEFLIRALSLRELARLGMTPPPERAAHLAACPTGFETSARARLARERRALLAVIARQGRPPGGPQRIAPA